MNEIGEWLGPAIAALWLLFRVVPRLLRSRAKSASETGLAEPEEQPTSFSPYESPSASEPPPPIEPR